ncbi:CARDB domain-containing protein [Methanobacterium sp.]|uniref:CARDB domain-containing protein n=1 Tax=Methanobacterium sp. TaxID=2164 RepID=UPI003C76A8AC
MKQKIIILGIALVTVFFLMGSVSAATFTLLGSDSEYSYSNSNYAFNIYFNDYCGYVETYGYRQISSVKITDIYGESTTLTRNIDFTNTKNSYGYNAYIDINQDDLGLYPLKSITVNFIKQPDLRIAAVKKSGNYYYITVKNYGDATARSSYLGTYIYAHTTKKTYTPYLQPGQYKTVKVYANSYYSKTFKADCTNLVNEVYEYNNVKYTI